MKNATPAYRASRRTPIAQRTSDKSNNEEGFEIQRQQKVGNFWTSTTLIASGPNTTSYTDSSGAGTFQYRVRSYNIAGSSAWTAWKSIKAR